MLKLIKGAKDTGLVKIMVLLALGLLLVFFGLGDRDSVGEEMNEEERVAALCSMLDGVGECRAVINYVTESGGYGREEREYIAGIAVVCEGGDSYDVKIMISELLSSLYGIGTNRITVEKMGK